MSVLYLDHFDLSSDPFRITPDTGLFFTGGQRGDILEGLVVASMHDEGIVSVVGEIGMGKTMLSRMLLERLRLLPADTVYLANPVFDRDEILGAIAHDLMPEPPQGNRAHMLASLEAVLIDRYAQGRRVVVVIDEAHSMPANTLEEIRLLSNLETTQHKLLKIVLFGQPELDELLAAPQLRQVKDRISHRFELQPLNAEEVSAYLMFRLYKVGWKGGELFDAAALRLLVQASDGRTRKLNMLADKAMLAAYAEGVPQVGVVQVRRAANDSQPGSRRSVPMAGRTGRTGTWLRQFAPVSACVLAALGVGYFLGHGRTSPVMEPAVASQPVAARARDVALPLPAVQQYASTEAPVTPAPVPPESASGMPLAKNSGISVPLQAGLVSRVSSNQADATEVGLAAKLRNSSLAVRMQATDALLARMDSKSYTVQLLSQRAPRDAEVLTTANEIQSALDGSAVSGALVLVHNRLYQKQVFHAMYVGQFDTRLAALEFLQAAPVAVKRYSSILRSIESIRKEPAP